MADEEAEPPQPGYEGERNPAKERHGKGVAVFANGDVYDGMYERGQRHGKGKYTFAKNGSAYEGDYARNVKHGVGKMTHKDGSGYDGDYSGDSRHGQGVYIYANGDCYRGGFARGARHGKGVYHFKQASCQFAGVWGEGEFVAGTWVFKDGTQLVGEFSPDGPPSTIFAASGTSVDAQIESVLAMKPPLALLVISPPEAPPLPEGPPVLNILLQEDLVIRGGAQLWLQNAGKRFSEQGHVVTFLLPEDSLIRPDVEAFEGVAVSLYDREKIAADPAAYVAQFTGLLSAANMCVTLVRPKRDQFQNVEFMAKCIIDAKLDTFLIAKTGTPNASYSPSFYGAGPLADAGQCCVITIAEYTRQFIMEHMGIPGELITNVYNGTDINKFKRTEDMAEECLKRYPLTEGAFVVGCIGSFEPRKGQKYLLDAAKMLVDDGRIPNIHLLMVGEGRDKEMLQGKVEELGLTEHATLFDFTKQPFYVFERCNVVALPSLVEGLPNVLLEALAMETPCVASRITGCPEVVIDGKTGYCFDAVAGLEGNVDVAALAEALFKIFSQDAETTAGMAAAGKELIFSEHNKDEQARKIMEIILDKGARKPAAAAEDIATAEADAAPEPEPEPEP